MFEKLLSNLPYNPGLVSQLGFYARRLRREESVRKVGLVFIILAFFVQFFAVISPPQSTSAYSTNDMINGGISSKQDAVDTCKNDTKNYGDVLWNFGISCSDVANASVTTVSSTDYGNDLYSMGWLPYGQHNPTSGKATDETSFNLAKVSETLYARHLSSFDTGDHSDYKALVGHTSDGRTFFILFTCGNLVFIHVPTPKKICQYDSSLLASDSQCYKPCQYDKTIPASSNKCFPPCQYNNTIPAGSPNCFPPCPIKGKENLPKSSKQCVAPCPYNKNISANNDKCFPPCQYNKSIPAGSAACFPPCKYNKSISSKSPDCFPPCPYNSSIPKTSQQCKPCTNASSSENALACVTEHKTVANLTTGQSDASGTTVQPNNILVYTLFAQNKGKATVKGFVMEENLSDVLDYATVVDLQGGTIDAGGEVVWPASDIKPGLTLVHKITVRVKNPIPQNPPDSGDLGHFDHVMTNVYGNTVNINVPGAPITPVVTASSTLPNTGPGTSIVIGGLLAVAAGYFFARTRLLVDESMIAIQETTSGGL